MRFLFVDRILQLEPGELIRGVKHVTQDDAYLCRDDSGRGYFIPSLIGEALGQLAAWNVMYQKDFSMRPVAGVVSSAKLHRPAYVGETVLLESFIDSLDDVAVRYHSTARVGDEVIFTIENALGPFLPMDLFIDREQVAAQFDEINRPGDWSAAIEGFAHQDANAPELFSHPTVDYKMTFDHIVSEVPGLKMRAVKRISRAAGYFPDHFPKKPVLPMTVLLESKLNLSREFVTRAQLPQDYEIREMRRIKMKDFVQPGDLLTTELTVKEQDKEQLILHFNSEVDGRLVGVVDVVLGVRASS